MLAPVLAAALSAQPTVVRIERAVARVVVIPEVRAGAAVSVRPGRNGRAPTVRREGRALVVDGAEAGAGRGGWFDVLDRGRCRADPATLPVITVRLPVDARLSATGAIWGQAGPSQTFDLAATGCGRWRIGPVKYVLNIATRGAPVVEAVGVDGKLGVDLKGGGGVTILGGHATTAVVDIDGTGDVTHRGSIGSVQADLRGSGKLRIGLLYGGIDASVHGTGDVFYSRDPKHFCGGFQVGC